MKLLIQPESNSLGKLLNADLASGRYNRFCFSVAYARLSGVDALYDAILDFCKSGGTVCAAVGIDQKSTSYEALMAILGFSEKLYILHNGSPGTTFHPKLYLLSGAEHARLYVGSGNLTHAGLYTNYEAVGIEDYILSDPKSAAAFSEVGNALSTFFQEGDRCKHASRELMARLHKSHMLCSEAELDILRRGRAFAPGHAGEKSLFKAHPAASHIRKHSFDELSPEVKVRKEYRISPAVSAKVEASPDEPEADRPFKAFYKRLSRNDVDLKSSPGQIIIPIAFKPFFEPLSEPIKTEAGAVQSERYFNVKYENTDELIENARIIFYVPSPQAPRKNSEVRFALRKRSVFSTLEQDDILVFTPAPKNSDYICTIRRVPHDSAESDKYTARFGWL